MHSRPVLHRCLASGFCVVLVSAGVLLAHDHPQHGADAMPPYDGPGYDGSSSGSPLKFSSSNVTLQSWIPVVEFGDFNAANDCWGYVSPSGREYAIIGLSAATAFVEITDPAFPQIVSLIDGPQSIWRDIKTYSHYAYAVSEGSSGVSGQGIQVIDLAEIDNGIVTLVNTVTEGGSISTRRTHNVAIDEVSGYLYRCGGGGGGGTVGLRIYSLADPANPSFVGEWHQRYVHDAQIVTYTEGPYAGKEIAFLYSNNNSGGGNPGLDILDVTDKSNIVQLGFTSYSFPAFSHQGWLTDDRKYVYLNDELAEVNYDLPTTTRVIDVSDLSNPHEVSTYTNGQNAIGHNIFLRGNLIFAANYRSGLRVFDASDDPLSPIEVGYFDTFPEGDGLNFNGLWGNYPFFPSGTIIGSDIEKGLFVWRVDALTCPIDLTTDGVVNVSDLLTLLGQWGACPTDEPCPADFNDDGVVNVSDLLILLGAWGQCPPW